VERAAVIADYTASAERSAALMSRLAPMTADPELAQAAALRHAPRPATMGRFFDGLDQQAGGAGPWLAKHGWTEADRAALRHKLLDELPSPAREGGRDRCGLPPPARRVGRTAQVADDGLLRDAERPADADGF
jgi:hypothetical protein